MELTSERDETQSEHGETVVASNAVEDRSTADQASWRDALIRLAEGLAEERAQRAADRQRWEEWEREWGRLADRHAAGDEPARASLLMGW